MSTDESIDRALRELNQRIQEQAAREEIQSVKDAIEEQAKRRGALCRAAITLADAVLAERAAVSKMAAAPLYGEGALAAEREWMSASSDLRSAIHAYEKLKEQQQG